MASCTIKAGDDWARKLSQLGAQANAVAAKAVAKGAGIVADQIRSNLSALHEDTHYSRSHPQYYFLSENEKFNGIPGYQKQDLLDSLGVTPIKADENGVINAKIGFDGYGSQPTAAYPRGLPNPLAARATESGSSIRPKQPFIRPALAKAKGKAVQAMEEVIAQAIEQTMK